MSAVVDRLDIARQRILAPAGLEEQHLEQAFARLMGPGVDAADIYFQSARSEGWVMEDGRVREGTRGIDQGVGVRAISGEQSGFAYSDEIVLPALMEASGSARAIARSGQSGRLQAWHRGEGHALYPTDNPWTG